MTERTDGREQMRAAIGSRCVALSIQEAAMMAGIARSTLWAMVSAGTGPRVTRIGRRAVVLLGDVEDWLLGLRDAR